MIKRIFLVSPRKRCQLGASRRRLSGRMPDRYVRRSLPDIAQGDLMAKLRHIALIVPDPEKAGQVLRGGLRHEVRGQGAPRDLCVRRRRQRRAAQEGRRREGRHLSFRHVGRRSRRGREEGGRRRRHRISPAGRPRRSPSTRPSTRIRSASCSTSPTPAGSAR